MSRTAAVGRSLGLKCFEGTRHTVTALVLALLAYGYYGLLWGVESLQRRLDTAGLDWVLLALAAIQAVFGVAPAM